MNPRTPIRTVVAAIATVALVVPGTAWASSSRLTMKEAQAIAAKFRQREAADDYGMSEIVQGAFDIQRESCVRVKDDFHITCGYHIEGRSVDRTGRNIRCGVEVRVSKKRTARHATGVRRIIGCARA